MATKTVRRYILVDRDGDPVNGRTYTDIGIANAHNGNYYQYRHRVVALEGTVEVLTD